MLFKIGLSTEIAIKVYCFNAISEGREDAEEGHISAANS